MNNNNPIIEICCGSYYDAMEAYKNGAGKCILQLCNR